LHMDVSRYARFLRPGHAVTGDRSQRSRHWMRPETRVGYDYAHAIVDDHSRLAYVELHSDERAATVTGFVERGLAFFAEHGIVAKRLMIDTASATSRTARFGSCSPARASSTSPPSPLGPAPTARGRTLPSNDGPRVGVGIRLSLRSTAQPRAATLDRALQHDQAAQLDRGPATDRPRSQRTWVAQLGSRSRFRGVAVAVLAG
jgi:hypothetical protein